MCNEILQKQPTDCSIKDWLMASKAPSDESMAWGHPF